MATMRRWAAFPTLALAAVLAALAFGERPAPASQPLIPQVAPESEADRPAPMASSAQIASLLARPLFSSNRRSATAPRDDRPEPSTVVLPRLAGITIAGTVRQATFALDGPGGSVMVGEGSRISGFTVQTIRGGEVILQDGATQVLLQPRRMPFVPKPAPRGLDVLNNVLLSPDPP